MICNVSFPVAPDYYAKKFDDNVLYHEVIAYGYFVTVFRNCQYWGPKEECRFCDINENARQMKESKTFTLNAPVKPVAHVEEVGREVSREALAKEGHQAGVRFLITGGTITKTLRGMTEDEFYAQYTRALKFGGPRRHVALQTNAKTKDEVKFLHSQGMDEHNANMEVWDRKLFEWINPGKNRRIGYDEWVKRMLDSVDILGEFNVRPNFVGGIEMSKPNGFATISEAVASTTEGIDVMMRHGVDPRFNQWRREPNTNLVKEHAQPPIPTEFYIRLMGNRYDLWKKYGLNLPTKRELTAARCYMGNDHGTYDDYPLLMEAPWYQDPSCRTPEQVLQKAAGWQAPRRLSIHGRRTFRRSCAAGERLLRALIRRRATPGWPPRVPRPPSCATASAPAGTGSAGSRRPLATRSTRTRRCARAGRRRAAIAAPAARRCFWHCSAARPSACSRPGCRAPCRAAFPAGARRSAGTSWRLASPS